MVDMRYRALIDEQKDYVKERTLASPAMLSKLDIALEAMYKAKKTADRKYYSDLFEGTGGISRVILWQL